MERDLITAAIEAVNTILLNGGGKDHRHFVCGSLHCPSRPYVAVKVMDKQPYRSVSLISSQRYNRSDGMKGPKKMKTKA